MQFHQLTQHSTNRKAPRVGRGGKRGKTSGRGTKGQKARAGRKMRPELRDIIKKIPKKRGYRFHPVREAASPINLLTIERHFEAGETVSPETLAQKKLVRSLGNKLPRVKILSQGELTKKLVFSRCEIGISAREKITNAGGTITIK